MFREIDLPGGEQILEFPQGDGTLLSRSGGGEELDPGQRLRLLRIRGEDVGHVAKRDHRPPRLAPAAELQLGSERRWSGKRYHSDKRDQGLPHGFRRVLE